MAREVHRGLRDREEVFTLEFRRNINRDNHSWNLYEASFYPRFVYINYDVKARNGIYFVLYTYERIACNIESDNLCLENVIN